MSAHLLTEPKIQFLDNDGSPLSGGKLYSYEAGTSTPLATYTTKSAVTTNANPTILDSAGRASVFIGPGAYKFVLMTADDVSVWTQDNVSHLNTGSVTTVKIADAAVTTPKIADASVTLVKLDSVLSNTITKQVGTVQMHHTFGGAAPIARGWMICNGDQITQANYEAIHGVGAYVEDAVGLSPIAGKYTPPLVGRYAVGVSDTTQDGASEITTAGNAAHEVPGQHYHDSRSHQWHRIPKSGVSNCDIYTINGTLQGVDAIIQSSSSAVGFLVGTGAASSLAGVSGVFYQDAYISSTSPSHPAKNADTGVEFPDVQSIQPDSVEVIYIVKVV